MSDVNGCEMTYSYLISEPDPMVLTYDVQEASCEEKNDGAIFAAVSGGTSPINFQWGTGANTQNIFDLGKGIYSLNVQDASGCLLPTEIIEVGFDGFNGCIEIPSGFTPNKRINKEKITSNVSSRLLTSTRFITLLFETSP